MAETNENLHKAKDAKQDEFYISLSLNVLRLLLNTGDIVCNRETSGLHEEGAF